ncbi:DUF4861 domain-containing protein [Prevotella communis]|uniref:DUF4861 domain-containing protein n=1 Tax=Prevotella communis TaxID=2913614 RepID=UPI001EDC790A|nr:DUF4861 domain-containing protein [Prevotella communis]UKK66497.1 DUF4861 domain-containing protein [Prevotella communis]UKK71363.1 DUF4861 domain-containing protein [Prevotella communis]
MKYLFLAFALCMPMAMSAQQTLNISVKNPLSTDRTDQPVVLSLQDYGEVRSALVTCGGQEIPCQLDDINLDEQFDELCFLSDLKGKEQKTYTVTLFKEGEPRTYPARVYAEMLMRNDKVKEKNKHNNFVSSLTVRGDCANSYNLLHHHGVDFESELNGIRIYFDKRQTLDLYGKFQKRLELEATQFYTSADQKKAGYGDDVLWVGNTFGLGAFRGWNGKEPTMIDPVKNRTQRVVSYGPLRTIVEIIDQGWQYPSAISHQPSTINMTIRYTQYAGHRDTDVDVFFNRDMKGAEFSTGIINVKGSEEFSDKKGLRACWGTDYPSTDTVKWSRETVGLGILIPRQHIVSEEPANKDNYAYVVKTDNRHLAYKVVYCSANETFGFHSAKEWFQWLKTWRKEVEAAIKVKVNSEK